MEHCPDYFICLWVYLRMHRNTFLWCCLVHFWFPRYHSNPVCPIFLVFTTTNDDKKMSYTNTDTQIELVQPNFSHSNIYKWQYQPSCLSLLSFSDSNTCWLLFMEALHFGINTCDYHPYSNALKMSNAQITAQHTRIRKSQMAKQMNHMHEKISSLLVKIHKMFLKLVSRSKDV